MLKEFNVCPLDKHFVEVLLLLLSVKQLWELVFKLGVLLD